MLNPFTPSKIASLPEDFFGREQEINLLARAISQGSVCIEGSFGIGKSSFMSRTLLHMDGFASDENCVFIMAVGHSDIKTVDDAAQLILEKLVTVESSQKKLTIGIPKLISYESTDAFSSFNDGRHLSALIKIVSDQSFKAQINNAKKFIIAIDECEKCADSIAKLMRNLSTELELQGINNLRYVLSGVSPFYQEMAKEDRGVTRFIYKTIHLQPFSAETAKSLLEDKFRQVIESVESNNETLKIDPDVIDKIAAISGGHPHLIQLLGSHVIEHEYEDPDGCIDINDLVGSLRKICYESRGRDYDLMIDLMKSESKFSEYCSFIELAGGAFPSIVERKDIISTIETESLNWLVERNILSINGDETYSVVDEFLRIRVLMELNEDHAESIESEILHNESMPLPGESFSMLYENTGRDDIY
jgi:AAA+ ATPase superfamily predicted ATPase